MLPIFILAGVIFAIAWYQNRTYGRHVGQVEDINVEIAALNRKNHELAVEQLSVLREIKTLLEDRKS
ncbi:MAG: hypothetical protein ACRDBL_12935 [Rhabdaerophilum sp.]